MVATQGALGGLAHATHAAAGVIEIEMRHDDVAHVFSLEAELLHLRERGLGGIELRPDEHLEHARHVGLALEVACAEAAVDEDQAIALGLDEQAMADHEPAPTLRTDQPTGDRAHRGAVEVMNRFDGHRDDV